MYNRTPTFVKKENAVLKANSKPTISMETRYRMMFFASLISFVEEYGYVLKDEVRVQQSAKMRDFLSAAKKLTYKLEKDLPQAAEMLNENIKENLFIFEEEFLKEVKKALGSEG